MFGYLLRRAEQMHAQHSPGFVVIASEIGTSSNEPNDYPAISADGHYLVFMSFATNFLTGAGNGNVMIYLAKTGF